MSVSKPITQFPTDGSKLKDTAYIKTTGFREYDARWWFGHKNNSKEPEISLLGFEAIGLGLGTLIQELTGSNDIVVGHDYRSYSHTIQQALIKGLVAAGARVKDIGLALTPTAYYAQFALDCTSVAMVTASHNDNGWSGVKMGSNRPITFGPDEMARLKEIVLNGTWTLKEGGSVEEIVGFAERYISDLTDRPKFKRKIKAIIACGNGTPAAFAPQVFERLGIDVIPMDTELDYNFPNYNPNPESMVMLEAMEKRVREAGADIALGFDGDGDRCGIVCNEGSPIFADKVGLLLARNFAKSFPNRGFVVDVKSTNLFQNDPILEALGATTEYYKTGHSYMKRRVQETGAVAGFERSGHYFFNEPIGRGYDDGILSAIAILGLLEQNPDQSIADLARDLTPTFCSPAIALHCDDREKYQTVEQVTADIEAMQKEHIQFSGQRITHLNKINGVRFDLDDGSWGLVRASSNEPKLVVIVESLKSAVHCEYLQKELLAFLAKFSQVTIPD